ncbi:hypothetical protein AVEN_167368-1, partial [Araneus ventricosus]
VFWNKMVGKDGGSKKKA